MGTSNFIKHLACNQCGSSDGNSLYDDGHEFCSVCSKFIKGNNLVEKVYKDDLAISSSTNSDDSFKSNAPTRQRLVPVPTEGFKAYRGISPETMKKYGIWTSGNEQYYPHYKEGVHVANQIRFLDNKTFLVQGEINKTELFGQSLFPEGGKYLTICEGHLDSPSAYQMFGSKYPVVSVRSVSSAVTEITSNWDYCNSFNEIVVCFDKDDAHVKPSGEKWYPGQEAAIKVASLFKIGKVRILTLDGAKDANDYLQKGWSQKFQTEWWRAPTHMPQGVKLARDMWEEISAEDEYDTQPYPWDSLNKELYGIRLSEVILITADTGVGKSQILREIQWKLRQEAPEAAIGLLHLEEPNKHSLKGLMSLYANKRLHLPDVASEITKEELKTYYDYVCDTDKIVLWDHFGSNRIDEVLNTVQYMAALGCKYVFIDHLSIIVSDQSGDERKELDEISTKLKQICMELNIAIIAVIHTNRKGEVRGSAGPEKIANVILKLMRNKNEVDIWRRNVTKVIIEKDRFSGNTGPGVYLYFNSETGRLEELTPEQIKQYENGLNGEHVEDFKQWRTEEVVN